MIRDSMKFSISAAAKATGKGKSTIHRAIQSGKLSASRLDDGTFEIDASELFRVFEPISSGHPTSVPLGYVGMELLEAENTNLKHQLERERQFVRSLEGLLAEANSERRKLLQLLTHQEQPKSEPKVKTENLLWKKIFRK